MHNKTKAVAVAGVMIAGCSMAQAVPFAEGRAGVSTWNAETSGDLQIPETDANQQWSPKDSWNTGFYLDIKSGVPVFPDVKVKNQRLNFNNDYTITRDFEANGKRLTQGDYNAETSIEHFDIDLMESIIPPNPAIELRGGIGARFLNTHYESETDANIWDKENNTTRFTLSLDSTVKLPIPGVQLSADYKHSPQSGKNLDQINAQVEYIFEYNADFNPGIAVGYQKMTMEDDDVTFFDEVEVEGVNMSAFLQF